MKPVVGLPHASRFPCWQQLWNANHKQKKKPWHSSIWQYVIFCLTESERPNKSKIPGRWRTTSNSNDFVGVFVKYSEPIFFQVHMYFLDDEGLKDTRFHKTHNKQRVWLANWQQIRDRHFKDENLFCDSFRNHVDSIA